MAFNHACYLEREMWLFHTIFLKQNKHTHQSQILLNIITNGRIGLHLTWLVGKANCSQDLKDLSKNVLCFVLKGGLMTKKSLSLPWGTSIFIMIIVFSCRNSSIDKECLCLKPIGTYWNAYIPSEFSEYLFREKDWYNHESWHLVQLDIYKLGFTEVF